MTDFPVIATDPHMPVGRVEGGIVVRTARTALPTLLCLLTVGMTVSSLRGTEPASHRGYRAATATAAPPVAEPGSIHAEEPGFAIAESRPQTSSQVNSGYFITGILSPFIEGRERLASYLPPPIPPGSSSPELVIPKLGGNNAASLERLLASPPPGTPDIFVVSVRRDEIIEGSSPDPALVLRDSTTNANTKVQRRSPVTFDPNIRGFKNGQLYAVSNGANWLAARQDLDSMLSKIDSSMIQDIVVIPGPYGVRYGPGFSFIDVIRQPTPRYTTGPEIHFDSIGTIRANGGQVYGREVAFGGGANWGFRTSYGHRKGSDYEAGNGLSIPSSYNNRDVSAEFGYDINRDQHVEVAFNRFDQTDTEYPGQFFNVDFLSTYGFEAKIVDEDPSAWWSRLELSGWYNRTNFAGSTWGKRIADFPVLQRVDWAVDSYFHSLDPVGYPAPTTPTSNVEADTAGSLANGGCRSSVQVGDPEDTLFRVGTDFRYLAQRINEVFNISFDLPGMDPIEFGTDMPHSWMVDPGIYTEWSSQLAPSWKVATGGRVDWVNTHARASDLRQNSNLPDDPDLLNQNDALYAFYLTNEFEVSEECRLRAGFGHSQRPPTLVERYADGLFLSIVQSGFTRVVGDPRLKPARNWQLDTGLDLKWENWRTTANFYYAFILDYITLEDGAVPDFLDARLVRYTNTDLATLFGFELVSELDLTDHWTAFGRASYVEGEDRQIDEALPAIPPLEGTVGLRLHDGNGGRRWGVDLSSRIVDNQDRVGLIRSGNTVVTLEEATPGFTVWNLRGYWNRTDNLKLLAGIENVFDRNYQEHLDLRLLGPSSYTGDPTRVLSPGFTPYVGVDWVF